MSNSREPQEGLRRHKLLTAEIKRQLPKLRAQDGKGDNATVHLKLFCPYGRGTYYITEGEPVGDDWIFFGYTISPLGPDCDEWGEMSYNEFAATDLRLGGIMLPAIERDCHFTPAPLAEVLRKEGHRNG
jgi:hypothetical protein